MKADDTPAIEAVLSADVKMSELKREQKFVMAKFEKGDMSVQDRMQEIDEELMAMGAESAEPRARRILSGLGFTDKMQTRATKGNKHVISPEVVLGPIPKTFLLKTNTSYRLKRSYVD